MKSAVSYAIRQASSTKRLFVDWEKFRCEEIDDLKTKDHCFVLSSWPAWWDECCHRQITAAHLAPYPETALCAPYLEAIQRGHDEPERIDFPHMLSTRPPLYFDGHPHSSSTLVYADIDAAYFSIYTRAQLDIYYDGEVVKPGRIEFTDTDRLHELRIARNALIGMLRRTWKRRLDHGKPLREEISSELRRANLWGLIMDCLGLCAWRAVELGAVYYHTDGAIFTSHDAAQEWIDGLWDRYRLRASVRAEGPGWVRGMGHFRIGEIERGTSPTGYVDTMSPRHRDRTEKTLSEWLTWSTV